ncbi:MAG: hypothetical protein ACSLFE_11300 [Gemmatimonadaceae bacterium]
MQGQAEIPPAQPTATAPTAPQVPTSIRIEGVPGTPAQTITVPLSAGEVRELRARRSELLDQLQRAQNRRELVVNELPGSEGANRAGLEQRLAVLDERIVQLESEMAATERLVAASPGNVRSDARSGVGDNDSWVVIPVLLILFVAFPLVFAHARRIWKRAPAARINPAEEGRLERIEQAVEAIAIEVERVSEGQRFVTKLLSDTSRTPLSLPADR